MTIQPLSAILTELSLTLQALANQHVPPIPLDQELIMRDRALQSGITSQVFRAIEVLILSSCIWLDERASVTTNSCLH
jgi:hypothetical protein